MAAFTPGNILVYRVGTGGEGNTLSNAATQVYIDEYNLAGTRVQSIALPGTGTATKLTSQGTSSTEGMINLTVDGKYLLLPGYNATIGSTTPATATADNAPRVIGRVGADGVVDLSTILSDLAVANRSVASTTGSVIYDATSTGVRLANYGVSASSTAISGGTERTIGIFNNQLYVSTAAAINMVGTGLPTTGTATGGQTPITFTTGNMATLSSIYGFFFADLTTSVGGVDTLYVADDAVGLVKFSLVGTSWTYNGIIGSTAEDYRGLTASVSGTTVTLYVARDNGTVADTLVQVIDTGGYNAAFSSTTQTLIATAGLNTAFRGVAFVPQNAVATTETIGFSSAAITQAEGDTGTTAYTITLTRSGSTAAAASVAYRVGAASGSTGLDASDFGGTLPSGSATFAAGSATATIVINVSGDQLIEATEQFVVTLSGPSAGYLVATGGATQTETITNDDVAGSVSVGDVRVDEGAGTATIVLTRTGGSADVTVTYATADGTATAGQDYTAASGTASFTGGATSTTVTVAILNDGTFEGDETFALNIAAGTGAPTIARASGTVTILDNDQAFAPGTFAITPATASVTEGGTGSTPISFTVTRTDGSFGAVTVPYTITFTGTNPAGATDFATGQTFSGSVTFADGQTTAQAITLQVQGDNVIEPNETFTVTLGTPSAGTLATASSAVGTIVNDDSAFAIAAGSASEATSGVPFVVTRTGDLSQAATLAYTVSLASGDTATAADFTGGTLPSGTVSFAAGAATATVTVPVLNDTLIEANETFTVTLSGAGANQTIATASATGTILNDDQPLLTINDPSVVEGNAGTTILRYTVTSNVVAPAGGISFDIATADGTATAGADYVARSVTGATIAAGQTSYTFDVVVNGDTAPERAETVLVNLSNPTGAGIADAQGLGIIDNDDGAPAGLQTYFTADFTGFTAAGFTPTPAAGQLNSNVWRVGGMSDLANPAYGGTYTTGDFARGVIVGAADPTSGGTYSPSANGALVAQPTGTDFENGGFFEAQLVNTTGFAATSFEIAFDWAYRNSGGRSSNLAFSYSTDGVSFTAVPAAAFSTPGAADATVAATFSTQNETLSLSNLLVGSGDALYLRWTHTGSTGGGNRDEVGIDNVVVRAGVSDIATLSAADISVVEGTGSTSFAVFTITRSTGIGTASVGYATADGTALAGRDYTAQSGTVTFAEDERSKTVTVAINPDSANEANETFFLNLTNATGVSVTDTQARATIVNDDTGPVAIYDIQGAGHVSPFSGQIVTTVGIVTAINANSYWVQDATGDGIFATSDAIQVVFGTGNASGVLVGDRVQVRGTVTEFVPATGALSVTELTAPTVMLLERGVALPAAVLIGVDGILPPTQVIDNDRLTLFDPTQDGIDFYEALEGMLVTVEAPLVVGNSDGRATFIVASGGVGATGINDRGGITLSAGDDAPERIQLFADSTLLPGYTPSHTVGDVLGNITGILTYFTYPELLPTTPVVTTKDVTLQPEITALSGDANHLLVASFNIENADPLDPQAKFDAIGAEVTSNLARPDIIGLQEVQDADGAGSGTNLSGQATADKIIAAIKAAGGPTYVYIEIAPTTPNSTGGEPGGNIRNGYLYNPDRVTYVAGSAALVPGAAFVGTRSPLAATFVFAGQNVTLIDAHSTSRGGSDLAFGATQPPAQAGDAARTAQATAIKAYIDGLQAANPTVKVVTVGDFNGYYYETALSQFTNDGKQTNLYTLLPVEERYSYLFDGAVQAFDNIIVTNNLLRGTTFDVVHINAQAVNQPITDHDQALASIYFNTAPTDLTLSNASVAENAPTGTLVGTVTGTDSAVDTLRYSLVDDAGGRFAIDAATGRVTTTGPLDFETLPTTSITVRVTDNDGLSYDEAFRIAVTDVNEAPTALTINTATVVENAPAGTLVGTLAGTDPERGTLRYSLVDSAGGLFAVDATTGRVTTTAPIDFETRSSANIVARVTDAGGLTLDRTLTIAVTNVDEAPNALSIDTATVAENAAAGTLVGTVTGVDPERGMLRYSLVDSAGGLFAIDATTGRVTTTAPIDFETRSSANIVARVTDAGGQSFDRALTITVTDVNEAPTALTINTATVVENAPAGTLVGTLTGVDPERGTLRYSLVDSAGGLFAVDATNGRVTTTAPIDFETRSSATIVARVTDAGGLTFDRTLTVAVTNVNEAPSRPVLTGATVVENAAAGTVIGTLTATDPDAGDTLTFSLVTADARFRISGNQLIVASGAVIDYETQQSIALSIAATDRAGLSTTAAVTLTVTDVAETLPGGTSGNDTLTGGIGADIINAGDGNDIVNGGLGRDTITLGAGADTVRGLLSEIVGDTITDFTFDDRLIVLRSDIARSGLTVSGTGASTVVTFPGGGTLALPAGLTGGDLMAAHLGTDSIITFNPYLASLSEGGAVAAGSINGITNQAYLAGDTATSFTVSVESLSGARFANSLGVYEIDSAGVISDVRIIAANVKNAGGSITVSGVDAGHQLGFFIVQDGANKLSSAVLQSTGLSLIAQNGHLVLANNGTAVGGATTFFSHSAAANVDGQVHVLSGVSADGQGAIRIGFEDLARGGSASDNDFQDVVITVAAVPMAHATSSTSAAEVLFASGDATADTLHYMPAHEAIAVHDFVIA